MKKLITGLLLLFSSGLVACPTFLFHITHGGTSSLTFTIQDLNNPSSSIQVLSSMYSNGMHSIDAWSFAGNLAQPCGITFASNRCYKITVNGSTSNAQYLIIKFNGQSPNNASFEYDITNETFNLTNPGAANTYTYSIQNASLPALCSACFDLVYIMDNFVFEDGINTYPQPIPAPSSYNTSLTESNSFIWVESTVISNTGNVRLDANPQNGYILLTAGFETKPGAIFIAQALDGCGLLIPQ